MEDLKKSSSKSQLVAVPRWTALVIAGWLFIQLAWPAHGQWIQLLDPGSTTWRYATNQGTAWRQPGFNDSAWPAGTGLFGSESVFYPYPFNTVIRVPSTGGPITGYYRTHFNWSGNPSHVELDLRLFIDDGCIIYLNGIELTRFNISADPVLFAHFADTANPGGEPVSVSNRLSAPNLREGDNVIAVEVHQSSIFTSDHVFGLGLAALVTGPSAPTITVHPRHSAVRPAKNTTFTVWATGSVPLQYQWHYNGIDLPGATNATLILKIVDESKAGQYSVTVSNGLGNESSAAATLTVDASLPLATYHLPDDFSVASNPSGLWSYGSKSEIEGATALLAYSREVVAADGVANQAWEFTASQYPSVLFNPTTKTATSDGGQGVYPPKTVLFIPGENGTERNFGVIRFTVPTGHRGMYTIKSAVRSYLDGPLSGDTDFHVVVNGAEVFGRFIPPQAGTGYTNTLMLDPGGWVEFLVGRGQDRNQIGSALKIEATIVESALGSGLPLAVITQPASVRVSPGGTATFSVEAQGATPLRYQWLSRGEALPGETGSSLTIHNAQAENEGSYTVLVGNDNGFIVSNPASLALLQVGSRLVVPAGFQNQNGQMGGVPTLTEVLRMQQVYGASMFPQSPISIHEIRWRPTFSTGYPFETTVADIQVNLSTTPAQPNALRATFAENVGPNDTVVFNGPLHVSSTFSGPAGAPKAFDIVLPLATPFLYNPAAGNLLLDIRNRSGSSASFLDISASTSDNASRAFATSASASTAAALDSGADILQLVYSAADEPPSILTHPENVTLRTGQTAIFSVDAWGGQPLTYQWQFNGEDLPGATLPTLTLSGVLENQGGTYTVRVSNGSGSALSQPATLTVLELGGVLILPPARALQNGTQGTPSLAPAMRVQQIYAPSFFPTEPIVIRQLRWRPHHTLGSAFDTTVVELQINLSTSSADPNQLSADFASNSGPDEQEVFHGPIHLSSAFSGPAQGPKDFDIIIPLQRPFRYDPAAGALLVDIRNFSPSGVTALDGTGEVSDGASRAAALSVQSTQAQVIDAGVDILQLIFSPPGAPPSIFQNPQSTMVTTETTAALSVTAIGDPPLAYQWRVNGTDLEGATHSILTLENVRLDQSGSYSVRVSNGFGSVMSQEAQLIVQDDPAGPWHYLVNNGFEETTAYALILTGQFFSGWLVESGNIDVLTHQSGFLGSSHTGVNAIDLNGQTAGTISTNFSTVAGRTYQLDFAFCKNPLVDVAEVEILSNDTKFLGVRFTQPNSTSALNWQGTSFVFTATSPATKLTFRSLTAGQGGAYLDSISVRPWQPAPHLFVQPLNQNIFVWQTASFHVEAGGSLPLSYQWLFHGMAIDGATSDTLVLNVVETPQAGLYSVRVTNPLGSVVSQEARLTVQEPPAGRWAYLINNGFEQTAAYAFVSAGRIFSGWRVDAGNIDVLTHGAGFLGLSHAGANAIDLNGEAPGTISSNVVTVAGKTYQLSFAYSKNPEINSAAAEVLINGAQLQTIQYSLPNAYTQLNWATSSVFFTASSPMTKIAFASQASGSAGLYLDSIRMGPWQPAPFIITHPRSLSAIAGASVALHVEAGGTPPFAYQWLFNGLEMDGATDAALILDNVQTSQSGPYSVRVSSVLGMAVSGEAELNVFEEDPNPETIVLNNGFEETDAPGQVSAGNVFSGWYVDLGNVEVLNDSSGYGPPDTGVQFIELNGTTAGTISSNLITLAGQAYVLTFAFSKNFNVAYASVEVLLDNQRLATVTYDQPNSPTWNQWQTTSVWFNATSDLSTLTFRSLTEGSRGMTLDSVQVTRWQQLPVIVEPPQTQIVIAGSTAMLNVLAVGRPPIAYQWRLNGTDIGGATDRLLVLPNVQIDQSGLYSVRVSNGYGPAVSQDAELTVIDAPSVPGAYPLNNGFEETQAYALVSEGHYFSGWRVDQSSIDVLKDPNKYWPIHSGMNFIDLNGTSTGMISSNLNTQVGQSYLLMFAYTKNESLPRAAAEVLLNGARLHYVASDQPNAANTLNWQVTSKWFTATSAVSTVAFRSLTSGNAGMYLDTVQVVRGPPQPRIVENPQPQSFVAGTTATLGVMAVGNPPLSYQWRRNGTVIDGATDRPLVLENVQPDQSGLYSVRVSNALGSVVSREAQLTVMEDAPGLFVLNSGFEETGAYAYVAEQQIFSGWHVDQGDIDVLTHGAGFFGPSHTGANAIDLNGTTSGIISSNLNLVLGKQYELTFAFSKNPERQSAAAEVLLHGERLLNFSYARPNSGEALNWQTTSVWFNATSPLPTLAFRSMSSGNAGIYLDTIQVIRRPQVHIRLHPQSHFAALGGTALFEVQAGGDLPFAYQWLFQGMDLPGETHSSLSLNNVQFDDQGEYAVRVSNAFGPETSDPAVMTVLVPTTILTQPQGLIISEHENAMFEVTSSGSEPLTYQWFHNGTVIAGTSGPSLVLTNVSTNAAGNYTVTVSNPVGSVTSEPATLVVLTDLGRAVLLPNTNTTLGATVSLPVLLLANGDENGVGFSIVFNASRLDLLGVALGPDATGAFLNVNDTQAASGRLGLNLVLPFGQTFPEGTQTVASVTFHINPGGGAALTPLAFGDNPIVRDVSDIGAESLPTLFVDGSMRVSGGLEADVSPGQDGNSQVTITDWVKVGRYAAGLDVVPNATHFQRSDCAPRSTLGNGLLSISDWVQAGRYAALLDPWAAAGGPTSNGGGAGAGLAAATQDAGDRTVQILSVQAEPGQSLNLPIQLSSTGHENALGFSLRFDPAKLRFLGAGPGADTTGASFNVNSNQQAGGSLGLALSLPVGAKFAAGTRKIALVQFAATSEAAGNVAVGFSDDPVVREVSDPLADVLASAYNEGTVHVMPVLHIRFAGPGLILSWPAAASAFLLEARDPAGGADSWSEVEAEKVEAGDEVRAIVPAAETSRFYRLRKP